MTPQLSGSKIFRSTRGGEGELASSVSDSGSAGVVGLPGHRAGRIEAFEIASDRTVRSALMKYSMQCDG
jgi:hypothetical protein